MTKWKKDIFVSLLCGAVIVGALALVGYVFGAKIGHGGPMNIAGELAMLAFLPGCLLISWIPDGEEYSWLVATLFYPSAILSYAFPTWLLLRIYRKSAKSIYDKKA